MPEISRFCGIVIVMYANEHGVPHFHAIYQEFEISVEIESGIVEGRFPPKELRFVQMWLELHRDELLENWASLTAHRPAKKIAPLK
jgi:hypothetical protein